MIKVVNPSVEVWKQDGYDLESIFKHVARCARVCYQSTPKNKDENAYDFLVRTIFKGNDFLGFSKINVKDRFERILAQNAYGDVDLKSLHLSCCEHATVHLKFPTFIPSAFDRCVNVYSYNKYSRSKNNNGYVYVTTNLRVIIENYAADTLDYIDETPNCPYYIPRPTVCFITDIGASRELNRHRVNSISEESTRYCAYDKGKFGNGITVAKLPWIPDVDPTDEGHDYTEGFFNDNEVFDNNVIEEQYTNNWTAVDWFFYGLQVCDLVYRKTRELGWTAQQAREILPLNTKTQVVHTAFVDDWEHWIALRSNQVSGKVHPMMGELAKQLIQQVYPE
jgi:thymidylate synthase (FAD)